MRWLSNHKIGSSKPKSLGSGKSSIPDSIFSTVFPFLFEIGVLPFFASSEIVMNEKTKIKRMPDNNVAMGIIQPVPETVDIPANATTKRLAPNKRIPLELLVILISRTKVLMNLAHSRAYYDEFW